MPRPRKKKGKLTVRKDKLSKQNIILYLCGIIPVVWLGLLIAPCMENGLVSMIQEFGTVMENPFQIKLCEDSVKTVLVLLLVYGIAIGVYLSTEHNYRRREEHGSARWGSPGSVNKKYADKRKTENKLLTQNVAIGLDGRKHRRNLNVLVCGGSGAGKTRFFAKPNIMNANTSFVVLDPKGELLRDTGNLLKEQGYDIKVLDLINMEKSHYLKHSFEKAYSDYGVPYIDEACATGISNNLVIYGHHMKNGTMFSDLCNYTDADFCKEHPIINFDTLSGFGEYQIVAVFKFDTNHEDFRYNEYTQMNEEQFKEFMSQVHARQCYDTGIDAEYGDQLITLSTCEYTYNNGRFVVVAKKV